MVVIGDYTGGTVFGSTDGVYGEKDGGSSVGVCVSMSASCKRSGTVYPPDFHAQRAVDRISYYNSLA